MLEHVQFPGVSADCGERRRILLLRRPEIIDYLRTGRSDAREAICIGRRPAWRATSPDVTGVCRAAETGNVERNRQA
jgi:hypothetical protein